MKQKTFKEITKELNKKGYAVIPTNVIFNGCKCYNIKGYNSYGALYTAKAIKMAYYEGEFI